MIKKIFPFDFLIIGYQHKIKKSPQQLEEIPFSKWFEAVG